MGSAPPLPLGCLVACERWADCTGPDAQELCGTFEELLALADGSDSACQNGVVSLCVCMAESTCSSETMTLEPDCYGEQLGPLQATCAGRCLGDAGPAGDPAGWSCDARFYCPGGARFLVECDADYTCACRSEGQLVGERALPGSCPWSPSSVPTIASSCCGV